ncbi:hypothetical protein L486_03924 [Kwoniella mangroviensis CBS 10435]|uniref:Mitochondrial import inner membrane translocase subunit Tim21 n=1 Tax=Kwoniella mangroviensis CBS 10435 TaxID=1331196 RepID=A0A1B9IQT1_9TREE|nr:uncharacterized protein I203_02987 [Kwoniella mangroviensis CBS 8507]OCF57902.1 hypothetical protein L486_03924 [Kwoniella mangroviensis CBS 10435]OCF68320.1 hypothetical protein I203_02987 [Kwoniella mangroviensis CBS 8507]
MARPLVSMRIILNTLPQVTCRASPKPASRLSTRATLPFSPIPFIRTYATHKSASNPSPSSSADATADLLRNSGAARRAAEGPESVGPFPLGVGASGRRKTWRSWSELGIGGKLVRTTQQTGNLAVILIGGTLFVILTLSLTTELFATNSPSVLYSKAVDMIRDSDALNAHLLPPLKFTHSPSSSAPVRGSSPIPHTFIKHPTSGRDHMLLTFWVHGRGKDEPEQLGWLKGFYKKIESYGRLGLTYVGLIEEGSQHNTISGTSPEIQRNGNGNEVEIVQQSEQGLLGRWLGSFTSSLRNTSISGGSKNQSSSGRGSPPPGTYTIGECRAEYVKNASGQYTLLSLFVDIPSSKVSYPSRAVIYHSPEAATEGLLGTRIR